MPSVSEKVALKIKNFLETTPEFYVLDTETTGLGPTAEICEISVIDQDGKPVIDTLVQTLNPIPDEATAVHGINDDAVRDAPTWVEVVPKLREVLKGKVVLIYNAQFDIKMIQSVMKMNKIEGGIGAVAKCVMLPMAEWNGEWNSFHQNFKWPKLSAVADKLGIDYSGLELHRAISDCQLTLEVIKRVAMWEKKDDDTDSSS